MSNPCGRGRHQAPEGRGGEWVARAGLLGGPGRRPNLPAGPPGGGKGPFRVEIKDRGDWVAADPELQGA